MLVKQCHNPQYFDGFTTPTNNGLLLFYPKIHAAKPSQINLLFGVLWAFRGMNHHFLSH
jgi:hypothetical protein